jgi:hypothetical protein
MMGLSWQQGPLGRNPSGTFVSATPMPERVLYPDRNLSVDELCAPQIAEQAAPRTRA